MASQDQDQHQQQPQHHHQHHMSPDPRRARRPLVGVVADDITGSGDIGIMFAKHGYAVRIFTAETDLVSLPAHLRSTRTDVAIIDTDSRLDDPETARRKVVAATEALRAWGADLYWKKTCSVFRGNVGAEFDAMLEALEVAGEPASPSLAVAAFPKNGRQTLGGIHYVHGKPLAESEFARDPVHPRKRSDLVAEVQSQTERPVSLLPLATVRQGPAAVQAALAAAGGATSPAAAAGYIIADAESQDDLFLLAQATAGERVLLGSSALAEELPRVWTPPPPFDPLAGLAIQQSGGVLVLAGSVMPQTRAQIEAMAAAGALILTLTGVVDRPETDAGVADLVEAATVALGQGRHVVVRSENWPEAVEATRHAGAARGMDPLAVSRHISSLLARVAQQVLARTGAQRLITLGGDTSAAACRRLGITETVVLGEIQPGLPSTLVPGPKPLLLVLKSGSFGAPDFVLKAIDHLQGFGRP